MAPAVSPAPAPLSAAAGGRGPAARPSRWRTSAGVPRRGSGCAAPPASGRSRVAGRARRVSGRRAPPRGSASAACSKAARSRRSCSARSSAGGLRPGACGAAAAASAGPPPGARGARPAGPATTALPVALPRSAGCCARCSAPMRLRRCVGVLLVRLGRRHGVRRHDAHGAAVGDQRALVERRAAAERLAAARLARPSTAVGREIIGEAAPLFLGGGVDQPHQQEERHHGGDEIGVGDLPGAAVVAALDHFLAPDHDRRRLVARPPLASHPRPPSETGRHPRPARLRRPYPGTPGRGRDCRAMRRLPGSG